MNIWAETPPGNLLQFIYVANFFCRTGAGSWDMMSSRGRSTTIREWSSNKLTHIRCCGTKYQDIKTSARLMGKWNIRTDCKKQTQCTFCWMGRHCHLFMDIFQILLTNPDRTCYEDSEKHFILRTLYTVMGFMRLRPPRKPKIIIKSECCALVPAVQQW